MRSTCLLLGVLMFTFLPARAGHSPPKVVLRVHVQTTGDGLSPMEATTISLPPNGEQIQVRTLPEVTEQQLIGVEQDASGNLRLQFNHVGQVNLNAVTSQNQGRILVVLINGYVVYAPIIDQQINNGELDIPHSINSKVFQLLQEVAKKNVRQAAKT
jgi:hypothetical protein